MQQPPTLTKTGRSLISRANCPRWPGFTSVFDGRAHGGDREGNLMRFGYRLGASDLYTSVPRGEAISLIFEAKRDRAGAAAARIDRPGEAPV